MMYYIKYCVRVKTTCEAEQLSDRRRHITSYLIPKTPMDLHSSEAAGIQSTLNVINMTNGMDNAHRLPLGKHFFTFGLGLTLGDVILYLCSPS